MIRKNAYQSVGGSEAIKNEVVEDLALFKNVKASKYRCELAIGSHIFATRMYQSWKEAWVGWRRIYLHAFDKNVPSLLHKIFMLIFFSFLPFAFLIWSGWEWLAGNAATQNTLIISSALCALILFLRSRSHMALKVSQWAILLHPLSALMVTGIILDCLRHHFLGRKVEWKAQHY